jgi:transcriptional regulator with XRE-family HTH domain
MVISGLPNLHPRIIADPMLTGRQLRAARAFLGWSRQRLSKASGVPAITIEKFERGADSKQSTIIKLRRACEKLGVVFLDGSEADGEGLRAPKGKDPRARKPG